MRTFVAALTLFSCISAIAAPKTSPSTLQRVHIARQNGAVNVYLNFDKTVSSKNFSPIFERNFVQLVLKSTRMNSAQIVPIDSLDLAKVFAYPYASDIVRVRLILKRENDWAKGRINIQNDGPRVIRVSIRESSTSGTAPTAAAMSAVQKDQENLLSEVQKGTKDIDIHNPDSVKAALNPEPIGRPSADRAPSAENTDAKETSVGSKAEPAKGFWKMLVALLGVLAVFFGVVTALKRYSSRLSKLPFGKKERLIQVVATHYLGSKKSISLLKVTGEYLVVGVSNEGVSLITKLGAELNVDRYLEDRFWNGTFEKHLGSFEKDKAVLKDSDLSNADALTYDGARDLGVGATRAEKLASAPLPATKSIKDKLMKLKPLS